MYILLMKKLGQVDLYELALGQSYQPIPFRPKLYVRATVSTGQHISYCFIIMPFHNIQPQNTLQPHLCVHVVTHISLKKINTITIVLVYSENLARALPKHMFSYLLSDRRRARWCFMLVFFGCVTCWHSAQVRST